MVNVTAYAMHTQTEHGDAMNVLGMRRILSLKLTQLAM